MLALLATLGIFAFSGIVGYALVIVTAGRRDDMLVLLSPAIGGAVIVLATMFLNYLGAPVRSFGAILAAALLIASAVVLRRSRPHAFSRSLYVIAAVLAASLLLTGRPLLEFGFDWLSFVNDDMNTYVFGAQRMFEHGFLTAPDSVLYSQNRAAIESFYLLDVLYNNRTGVENLLAFWMAVLRLDGYHVYMPLIMALQLTLISAATGLTLLRSAGARVPVATATVLAVSAMVTLGTDLQVIAQACGLGLMAASLGLACATVPAQPRGTFARRCILCAVPVAGLAAVYPEIFPLLGIAVGAYFALAMLRKAVAPGHALAWLGSVAIAATVLLNVHLSTFLEMTAIMLSFGQGTGLAPAAFPYFLVPSGLPQAFGIIPVSVPVPEPLLSLSILAGMLLLAASIAATAFAMARRELAGFGCFALLLIVPLLMRHHNGFALYKLAMYLQPFLVPTLVGWWAHWPPFLRLRREAAPA